MRFKNAKLSGIYSIGFFGCNKIYIGSSFDICRRGSQHLAALKTKRHKNIKLQSAFNKYGEDNFIFSTVETIGFLNEESKECKLDKLRKLEQEYLDVIFLANSDDRYFRENSFNLSKITKGALISFPKRGKDHWRHKVVLVFDLDMNFIEEISGLRTTEKKYNMTGIHECCQGKISRRGKFIFRYKDNPNVTYSRKIETCKRRKPSNIKPIFEYDKNGKFIREWDSREEATIALGFFRGSISKVISGNCKHVGGRIFRNEKFDSIEPVIIKNYLIIDIYDKNYNFLYTAKSVRNAEKFCSISRKKILDILKTNIQNKTDFIFKTNKPKNELSRN